MSQPFPNGRAINQAIRSIRNRLYPHSKEDLLRIWMMQRLLTRLAADSSATWAVKGAQALLIRLPRQARFTRDIDAIVRSNSVDEAVSHFTRLIEAPTSEDDFLDLRVTGVSLLPTRPGLVRIVVSGKFNTGSQVKPIAPVHIDLLVTPALGFEPEWIELRPTIDVGRFKDWPSVPIIAPAVHVAEKLAAMYTTHQGEASTRDRDFADLVLLCRYFPPHLDDLVRELITLARQPLPSDVRLELPEQLVVNAQAEAYYRDLEGMPPFEEALMTARAVVNPALNTFHSLHHDESE